MTVKYFIYIGHDIFIFKLISISIDIAVDPERTPTFSPKISFDLPLKVHLLIDFPSSTCRRTLHLPFALMRLNCMQEFYTTARGHAFRGPDFACFTHCTDSNETHAILIFMQYFTCCVSNGVGDFVK